MVIVGGVNAMLVCFALCRDNKGQERVDDTLIIVLGSPSPLVSYAIKNWLFKAQL